MENTDALLFDSRVRMFVVHGDQVIGPMALSEVVAKLRQGELSWVDFGCDADKPTWSRLSELLVFRDLLPPQPTLSAEELVARQIQSQNNHTQQSSGAGKIWYVFDRGAQTGPYSEEEITALAASGVLTAVAFVWRDGWVDWVPLADRKQAAPRQGRVSEFRSGPRKPLVARVFVAGQSSVVIGVCRDVSVGGMQVLSDHSPGPVGSLVKLNVSPSEGLGPFVADGIIVRVLEDGRGFSLRFTRLEPDAISSIEEYLRW